MGSATRKLSERSKSRNKWAAGSVSASHFRISSHDLTFPESGFPTWAAPTPWLEEYRHLGWQTSQWAMQWGRADPKKVMKKMHRWKLIESLHLPHEAVSSSETESLTSSSRNLPSQQNGTLYTSAATWRTAFFNQQAEAVLFPLYWVVALFSFSQRPESWRQIYQGWNSSWTSSSLCGFDWYILFLNASIFLSSKIGRNKPISRINKWKGIYLTWKKELDDNVCKALIIVPRTEMTFCHQVY